MTNITCTDFAIIF